MIISAWHIAALVAISFFTVWARIQVHVRSNDLSIIDLTKYILIGAIPVVNLIWIANVIYVEFSNRWDNIVVIKRRDKEGENDSFLKFLDKISIDVVSIDSMYAVRKTSTRFGRKRYSYLNLHSSRRIWFSADNSRFSECLTDKLQVASWAAARNGCFAGQPIGDSLDLTVDEFLSMAKLAESDVNMKDLLHKAKEWFILKAVQHGS